MRKRLEKSNQQFRTNTKLRSHILILISGNLHPRLVQHRHDVSSPLIVELREAWVVTRPWHSNLMPVLPIHYTRLAGFLVVPAQPLAPTPVGRKVFDLGSETAREIGCQG